MQDLAHKLMNLKYREKNSLLPSTIFGSATEIASYLSGKTNLRIAMWPILSESEPDIALGVMSVLALLLEQSPGITVYRVLARLEGDPSAYIWEISHSQFEVEDWQIDGLDDNVGIWGRLERSETGWSLSIEFESDLSDVDQTIKVERSVSDLTALIGVLPAISDEILSHLNVDTSSAMRVKYPDELKLSDSELKTLLKDAFDWDLKLLLSLWGKPTDFRTLYHQFTSDTWRLQNDFAAWLVTRLVTQSMLPGFAEVNVEPPPPRLVFDNFSQSPLSGLILGRALGGLGEPQEAAAILEENAERHPQNAQNWLALADLYRRSGDYPAAVNSYQNAIENKVATVELLSTYAQLLPWMDGAGLPIDEFVLIDPDQYDANHMTWEAIEAYEKALGLSPKNPSGILSQQGLLLIDLLNVREKVDDRLWQVFERLVEIDTQGEYVRTMVDNFFSLESIERGLDILERAVEKAPNRVDLHINLAAAYISGGEGEYAATELEEARRLTDDDQVYADIDQLMLTANDPDFEATMADIGDKVSAGSILEEDEVDYLEQVVESAPQYGDAYLLLAKAYQLWNDDGAAMETLLDAEKHLPKDPDVLEALGRLLWAAGERVSAFGYIKRGVEDNPLHIPLLSLMGQYLFEDDQRDAAKIYLARAEALSPNHAALKEARREIATILQDEA